VSTRETFIIISRLIDLGVRQSIRYASRGPSCLS
jgi:hypothetical protein